MAVPVVAVPVALLAAAVPRSTGSGWSRSGHRRALVAGAIVFVVVLGGGAAAWAASSSGDSGYRTASVTRADIGQSLTVVGSVEPVNDASAAFQVAGKVAAVTAAVGQQVTAGQSLGTLETTSLSETVSSDQSTVNADEAKLAQDESSQSTSTSPSSNASSTTTTTTTPASKGGGSSSTITQDQTTLTKDEAQTATDQQQEAADLVQAQKACGTTGPPTTSTTTTTAPTNTGACVAALAVVSKDQQQVSNDQATVAKDETALSQELNQTSSTSGSTGGSAGSGASGSSGSPTVGSRAIAATSSTGTGTGSAGTSGGTGGGGSSASASASASASGSADTPEQIASDQANIDSAQAQLTEAEQSLAEADLTSPINGTIVSVGISVGDTVSANSSTAVIVIIGTESYEVTGTLSSSQLSSVKVGDTADVEVDGVNGAIDGTISQVGPVQSSSGGYTYPVVAALPSTASGLFTGSTANVDIATGSVADTIAVPTSAVQSLGTRSYVETLTDGTLTRKVIKVGMIGDTYTQVLSGLTPGESVVLADYAEPVPSSNTATLGGAGGFGGGGAFGGGGFGGGAGSFRSPISGAGGGGFGG